MSKLGQFLSSLPDPNAQTNDDPNTQAPADPNVQAPADPNTQAPADPNAQAPADPNAQAPGAPETQTTDQATRPWSELEPLCEQFLSDHHFKAVKGEEIVPGDMVCDMYLD